MLKRIHVRDLTLGMFLHELCGSWMEHPFWRTRFLLEDPQDLQRILNTAIEEVWIDTARGRDVAAGAQSMTRAEVEAEISSQWQALETALGALEPRPAPPSIELTPPGAEPTPMDAELRHAAQVCRSAKEAVVSMFTEARMGRAVDMASVHAQVNEISNSVSRNPGALISLARLKTADEYTYMHSVAVCALMTALARQLGMDDNSTRLAALAGLLHDLGKANIPLAILNKPGKLTDEEFDVIRHHPVASHEMLQHSGLHPAVLDACLHHHEKIDGTGYPHRLAREQISTLARMTAICDVYDAITSNRPYKAGWDPSESLRRMAEWTRGHFDSRLFQAFVKAIGIYPVGSLVRLSSARLGVVVEQSPGTLVAPRVKVFFSTRTHMRIPPEVIDLSAPGCTEKITHREDPSRWHFPDLDELWCDMAQPAW
jgi:putative nucleotidyltransferase with HDIG domain